MNTRSFLFLQGPTSPFFSRLGDALIQEGGNVYRVNFNMGDWVYWRNKPSWQFRGNVNQLPEFLENKIKKYSITDIVMMGDTRPVSSPAVNIAKHHGVRLHIFDEGHLRPNYLTLEEDGINGYSRLPKNADWYYEVGPNLPPIPKTERVKNPIALLGLHEVGYHLPGLINPLLYPGYKTHRPYTSPIELAGWANRLSRMPYFERRDEVAIKNLLNSKKAYYILPLQLDSDSQITTHSSFSSMCELICDTLNSFATHAPENSLLVIKNHPLDTGFVNYKKLIKQKEKELGLTNRTLYLESGHLPTLLDHCCGVIVVNSTVGTSALIHNCKTLALANPIYNIPRLTIQTSLDQFWRAEHTPDKKLLEYFLRVVVHTTQINGGFFSNEGIRVGVKSAVQRLRLDECPMQSIFTRFPTQ